MAGRVGASQMRTPANHRWLRRSALCLFAALVLLGIGCDGGSVATTPDPASAEPVAAGDPPSPPPSNPPPPAQPPPPPNPPPPPPPAAFDFSGAWTMENTITYYPSEPEKVGTTSTYTCWLTQWGTRLSGSCKTGSLSVPVSGSVNGRSFAFSYQIAAGPRFTATGDAPGDDHMAGTLRGVSSGERVYESRFDGTR